MGLIMKNGISYGGGSEGGSGNANIVKLTQAEYDALPSSKNSDGILYAITDGDELSAKNLEYDGSVTGLGNNVQGAIDKLNSNFGNIRFGIDGDGNYGYYGADDSLIPFKKFTLKESSGQITVLTKSITCEIGDIIATSSYAGLNSWTGCERIGVTVIKNGSTNCAVAIYKATSKTVSLTQVASGYAWCYFVIG